MGARKFLCLGDFIYPYKSSAYFPPFFKQANNNENEPIFPPFFGKKNQNVCSTTPKFLNGGQTTLTRIHIVYTHTCVTSTGLRYTKRASPIKIQRLRNKKAPSYTFLHHHHVTGCLLFHMLKKHKNHVVLQYYLRYY